MKRASKSVNSVICSLLLLTLPNLVRAGEFDPQDADYDRAIASPMNLGQYEEGRDATFLLPANSLLFRSNATADVVVHLLDPKTEEKWTSVHVPTGYENTVKLGGVWIAIGTEELARPLFPIANLGVENSSPDGEIREGYFLRKLAGRKRYEICWNAEASMWLVRDLRESFC